MIDVFKVGVHIGMTSNAGQVLSLLMKELTGLQMKAGELEKSLGAVKQAALGVGAVFAGWSVISGISKAIEGNRELNRELEKTKQLGGDFAANLDKTRAQAIRTQGEVPTTTLSDNVRLSRELATTIGHPDEANAMLSQAAKTAYVISHYTGEDQEEIIKNLVRTADARGQIYTKGADGKEHVDPAKLQAEFEAAARGLIIGGGFLHSNDFLQRARMGGVATKGQTPLAFYGEGAEAAIAMGASRLGTAETGLTQQFVGGTMTKKIAEHLTDAGLLHDGEWHSGKSGGVVVNPGVASRFQEVLHDPVAWLTTGAGATAIKAYAEKNKIDVTAAVMQLFGRQTVQRLVNEAMSNEPQFARARQIYGQIPSVNDQYKELHDHDLDTNILELSKAWKSFMEAFSDAGTPIAIEVLHKLTAGIHLLSDATANHPVMVEAMIGLAGGIAALTALGGSLVVLNACWAPLAGGLTMLTGINFAGVATGLQGVARAIGGLGLAAGLAAGTKGALDAGADALYDKIHGAGSADMMRKYKDDHSPIKLFMDWWNGGSSNVKPKDDGSGGKAGDVYLDGKKVGMILENRMADSLSRPSTGGIGPDTRVSPLMPGMMTNVG